MPNERQTRRHRRRLNVSLGGRLPAVTADVSLEGFSVEMSHVFVPGSRVHGTLHLGEREVPFKGEVAWATPGNPQASTLSRFGVRFTETPDGLRDALQRIGSRRLVRWHSR